MCGVGWFVDDCSDMGICFGVDDQVCLILYS